jgi:4-aminobutyrate aminotransferase/(S)-3-amino-2-methylpropionate transaminase
VASASGAILRDAEGREVIDFAGGIGVQTIGHNHPDVVAAIHEQAGRLLHACIHIGTYEPYVALCEQLVKLLPHGGPTKAMLVNTGAEAVENAVKIARQATGRPALICFTDGFHGRTLLGMSLTSKAACKVGCGPFAPEVYRLPFPNRWRDGDGLSEEAFVARELRRFREALINRVPAEHVAAVVLEVVQGEGGFVVAPPAWLTGLRALCDEFGILIIADEVQSGFCRTGRWAACEHAGIVPDLSTWAKALGGGLPIGAVLGKAAVMDKARRGTLGGTYGGNPLACAAALAALGVMERENLNARAETVGRRIRDGFLGLAGRCPGIGEVRGLGAMLAMEFVHGGDPSRPDGEVVAKVLETTLERGLLLIPAGAHGNILRVLVPLTITDDELERGMRILEEAVLRHAGGAPAPGAASDRPTGAAR